jgi:hypothetical protein
MIMIVYDDGDHDSDDDNNGGDGGDNGVMVMQSLPSLRINDVDDDGEGAGATIASLLSPLLSRTRLLHCCYTVVTPLLHCCHTVV